MTELIYPVCGCAIVEGGYAKEGVPYRCEPCANGIPSCECSCCHEVPEEE